MTSPQNSHIGRPAILAARALIMLSPLGVDIYLPAVPQIAEDLGPQASLSISIYLAGLGLGQLVWGSLSDRMGRRPVAIWGCSLFALLSLLIVFSEGLPEFLGLRLLQGVMASSAAVCATAMVRDCYSGKDAAREYSILMGVLNAVPFAAPLIGGILTAWFSWRSCFVVLTGFGIFLTIWLAWCMPETAPEGLENSGTHTQTPPWTSPVFLGFSVCCCMGLGVLLSYVTLIPYTLMEGYGLSSLEFGVLFASNAGLISLVCIAFSRLIARKGPLAVLRLSALLMLGGGVLLVLCLSIWPDVRHVALFMGPVALICIGFSGLMGPARGMAMQPFERGSGKAAAVLGTAQMLWAAVTSAVALALPLPSHLILGGITALTAIASLVIAKIMIRRYGVDVLEGRTVRVQPAI
ncbi:multidrug effflux MFS transporter [Haematospirillum sp. H1815]|uniref:multidrug effflux MFS transporter n=1 Tax=Haematospirillum sp. H1815 TaxID=2723108 RepID=UPI00143AA562|nr:multidrug effflux MFS transporter [Haematospirillum sp. H1815]NKD78152.1 multidrug effflux MFS transporter [Haematospirillum sp. H1815]